MPRPPLDFDISVSADKRRRARRRGFDGATAEAGRRCEWSGCDRAGTHRAPYSRERLNDYRWFCTDHIRDYNRQWNYYESMDEDEILSSMLRDSVWDRPTWKMGGRPDWQAFVNPHAEGEAWRRFGYSDPLDVLGERATINPGAARAQRRRSALPRNEVAALNALGLEDDATFAQARKRYTELVKELHPDHNGGDRSEEDRLKAVIAAWGVIKTSVRIKR